MSGPVFLDIEHYDLGWDGLVVEVYEVAEFRVVQLGLEEIRRPLAEHLFVGEDVAEVLGEGRLTGAEETRDPDPYPLGRLDAGGVDRQKEITVLVLDPVGGDVLGDLVVDGVRLGLVELDDLFDLPIEVPPQQFPNAHYSPPRNLPGSPCPAACGLASLISVCPQ
jgi:hypothetical protein